MRVPGVDISCDHRVWNRTGGFVCFAHISEHEVYAVKLAPDGCWDPWRPLGSPMDMRVLLWDDDRARKWMRRQAEAACNMARNLAACA